MMERMKDRVALIALGLLVGCALLGCDHSSGSGGSDHELSDPRFVKMLSTGIEVVMGTDQQSAKANERPQMAAGFDYDFFIQNHEVTCGDFKSLMKVSVSCENDSLPVTDVSYYDAILYANALSVAEDRDTVYSYTDLRLDDGGHCIGMEGLAFRPEVDGFRLPTEAEWIFAANVDWNVEKSVTADDGLNGPAKVCSKRDSGLCDMEGNVTEWVNDWLGPFKSMGIVDFVGALDGGAHGERVVKGGNYMKESRNTNSYSRGDVYAVTSSTRAPYVGFRLARGVIPVPSWMSSDGSPQSRSVIPLVGSSSLRKFSGAFRGKLVFRNDVTGNLAYIDYSNSSVPVVELKDTINSYHPDISPDGRWVAFCTGLEGVAGKSSVYVRELKLNSERPVVKLDVESAAIPRWKILDNGDTVIVYVTDAGNNKEEGDFRKASTWQVKISDGEFGTPEKIMDGSFHGGVEDGLAVTGARLLRARVNSKDEVWYNSEQACNVSLSKGGDKNVLFLDFASKTGREFVGSNYGIHERLFFADSTGKLIQSMAAPAGYFFDHSEWASNDLVVASLYNANGSHTKIVAVKPSDSSLVELAEGDELWHPAMWVQNLDIDLDKSLDLDSAAVYSIEGEGNNYLQYKLRYFWDRHDSLEVIGLGNSHMSTGFCSGMVDHSLNMATVPCGPFCMSYLFENYILNQCPKMKYLLVSVDPDLWFDDKDQSLKNSIGNAPGFKYDRNHDFWKDGLPKGFVELSKNSEVESEAFRRTFDYYNGQFGINESNGWTDADGSAEIVGRDWDLYSDNAELNYDEFLRLVKVAKEREIYVIGIVFPMSPYYKETDQYGRHGMRRSTAEKYLERLKDLDDQEKYFALLDENKMGYHDYSDEMAFDYDHLNNKGSKVLTSRLVNLMETLK